MAHVIARLRPSLSAAHDHGMTAMASPSVAAETLSAAVAGLTPKSSAMPGSTAWTEYSWAKVAIPAKSNPSTMLW